MTGRNRRTVAEVLAESAPPAAAAEAAPAAAAAQPSAEQAPPDAPAGRRPKPVRSTLDLPPDEHAALLRFAVDAQVVTGRTVKGQNVLRALVRHLLAEDGGELRAAIVRDLDAGKGEP